MDDVAVYSDTFERHLENLEATFELAEKGDMKINPLKGHFVHRQVEFLGHIVSKEGIAVMPGKVEMIQNCKIPQDVSGVRSFLGLTGHYRRFIHHYAHKASPLISLTRKKSALEWGMNKMRHYTI